MALWALPSPPTKACHAQLLRGGCCPPTHRAADATGLPQGSLRVFEWLFQRLSIKLDLAGNHFAVQTAHPWFQACGVDSSCTESRSAVRLPQLFCPAGQRLRQSAKGRSAPRSCAHGAPPYCPAGSGVRKIITILPATMATIVVGWKGWWRW